MSSLSALPTILTSSDLAVVIGRSSRNVDSMAARGLLATPTHQHRGKPAWEAAAAMDWFRALHDHAVVVPANDLAQSELHAHGIYMCPMSSDHIGLARPDLLVMYEPGGSGLVFNVTDVEAVNQGVPGTRPPTQQTLSIRRDGVPIGTPGGGGWTVFYLNKVGAITTIAPVIQQGRYLPTQHVRTAILGGSLSVPKLVDAFPACW